MCLKSKLQSVHDTSAAGRERDTPHLRRTRKEPLITGSGLEKALEKRFNRGFSRRSIGKVADKVTRQALVDVDRMKIEPRLDFTRNNYRRCAKSF
jgi:hypothetical protein